MSVAELIEGVPSTLNYAIIGLGFIVCAFGFALLRRERGKRVPDRMMLSGIALLVGLGGMFAVGPGIVESRRAFADKLPESYRSLGTKRSKKAFMTGPSAKHLEGTWEAKWYQHNPGDGEDELYTTMDSVVGMMMPYPDDVITVESNGPHLWGESFNVHTNATYWLEGRISSKEYVTLSYWSEASPEVSGFTGVLFMKVGRDDNEKLRLEGHWLGYSRNQKIVRGKVVWRMVEPNE